MTPRVGGTEPKAALGDVTTDPIFDVHLRQMSVSVIHCNKSRQARPKERDMITYITTPVNDTRTNDKSKTLAHSACARS